MGVVPCDAVFDDVGHAVEESKARGVPNSPARPTGNTQVVLSSLVRNWRSCGVLTKSCTITTSVTSSRSASTSLR